MQLFNTNSTMIGDDAGHGGIDRETYIQVTHYNF